MTTIADIAAAAPAAGLCTEMTALQAAAGYVTWMNVFKTFAVVLGGVCFAYLFGRTVLRILSIFTLAPAAFYEAAGFLLSFGLLAAPTVLGVSGADATWFVVPGGILFAGTVLLSAAMREVKANHTRFFGLLTVVWGAAAVWHGNEIAGFATVMAAMACLGFSVLVLPMTYFIGFNDEKSINRAGASGLALCLLLVFERWAGSPIASFEVFRTGMEWLGPFVFALAILINSSRWAMDVTKTSYLGQQVMAVSAYSALIIAGGTFQIDALLNVGTGFMVLWLIEKPFEVRYKSMTQLAAVGLAVSLAVGWAVYWTQNNLDVVAQWMPALAG